MLRRLSLALAVAAATTGMAWAEEAPLASKTDLVTVYNEAVKNNADLAAARANYAAIKEVVPQARAGLLPNLSAGADSMNTDTKVDTRNGDIDSSRSGLSYRANLSQPLFRADRWYQFQAAKATDQQYALQLSATEQNLILQSAETYFAVLRAQDTLASTKAEEAAAVEVAYLLGLAALHAEQVGGARHVDVEEGAPHQEIARLRGYILGELC